WFYLFFATSAWQGSASQWANGHRVHHSEVDGNEDPYSIRKGFWFAHFKWMLFQMDGQAPRAADLEKEPGLRFQHDHYIVLGILCGYFVPALIGYFMNDFWGGLIVLGGLRVVATQQSTWFVNSLAHFWGQQTYTDENSARDNLIVAFLTLGEGYHNFHHKFQIDYRNGVRWYHWDPTKWWIRGLALVGAARKLKRVQATDVLKARLAMEARRLHLKGYSKDYLESLKERMLLAQAQIRKLREESLRMRQQGQLAFEQRREELKAKIELQKADFQNALQHWRILLKTPVKIHG
ncbi:MAG: fatty acid desaturase, partial [Bdellovibrio sp.]